MPFFFFFLVGLSWFLSSLLLFLVFCCESGVSLTMPLLYHYYVIIFCIAGEKPITYKHKRWLHYLLLSF